MPAIGEGAYSIEFGSRASREFLKLPQDVQRRIKPRVEELGEDPRPPGCEKLTGQEGYRIRVGDYRVVYEVDDGARIVTFARVAHPRDVDRA